VINDDIMKVDIAALVDEYSGGLPVSVCANLPYYITTPILMRFLESGVKFSSITIMIQNEVASRLTAQPGTADYGAITAVLNYYGVAKKLFKVSAGSFVPAPKVDSAVVRIDLYKTPKYTPKNEKQRISAFRFYSLIINLFVAIARHYDIVSHFANQRANITYAQ
jgi:16S rRNA (adenine1518-N6/adenine1519-N6)-dimethyltransferase